MADEAHIAILMKGVAAWNTWRAENPDIRPNLAGVDIEGFDLDGINLSRTNLTDANLMGSTLNRANMSWALLPNADMRASSLIGANFSNAYMRAVKMQNALLSYSYGSDARLNEANLTRANLVGAKLLNVDLREAVLDQANLSEANLSSANLGRTSCIGSIMRSAILEGARLIQTNLENADLSDSFVYGISTWTNNLKNTKQTGLKITPLLYQEGITVDSDTSEGLGVENFIVQFAETLNVDAPNFEGSVRVFPNPATTLLNVSASENIEAVKILNQLGQVVFEKKNTGNSAQIDVSQLATGAYFVQLFSNKANTTKKFIKQ